MHDGVVQLLVTGSDVHLDGLERRRSVIEEEIGNALGSKVKVEFKSGQGGEAAAPPPSLRPVPTAPAPSAPSPAPPVAPSAPAESAAPRRLDKQAEREERLKAQRAKDSGLDQVADALDLELIE
jgi:hypothetical protein